MILVLVIATNTLVTGKTVRVTGKIFTSLVIGKPATVT
jgi:hypothetical protein